MMKDDIEHFLQLFPKMTREEVTFIQQLLEWPDEKKLAFRFAKRLFDDAIKQEDDNENTI